MTIQYVTVSENRFLFLPLKLPGIYIYIDLIINGGNMGIQYITDSENKFFIPVQEKS